MAEARSPEKIAQSLVSFGTHPSKTSAYLFLDGIDVPAGKYRDGRGHIWLDYLHPAEAEQRALDLHSLIARAIRQGLATALDDPPLSSERLEDIRLWQHWTARGMPQNAPPWPSHLPRHEMAGLLLELIDHLQAQVRWLAQDSASVEAFEAGRRQGRQGQLPLLKECRLTLAACCFVLYSQSDEYRRAASLVRRLDEVLEGTP